MSKTISDAGLNLARAIHFDDSDAQVFHTPAESGEWAISGGFEFSNWTEADLAGKARQAFANGWLGLTSFGRVTFVAVTRIQTHEYERLCAALAQHFVQVYGAPSLAAARPVAEDELAHMAELCAGHPANTLLTVSRSLTEAGVNEAYRVISPADARLEQVAMHATPET